MMARCGGCWVVLMVAVGLSLCLGSSAVGPRQLAELVAGWLMGSSTGGDEAQWVSHIFWAIRLPRTCVAALCGGALGMAGVICQGLFRNVLASPVVLGTTSGATLFAVAAFYSGLATYNWYSLPLA